MSTVFMEASAFQRLETELRTIDPAIDYVLMQSDSSLTAKGQRISIEAASARHPEIAWLNVGISQAGMTETFVKNVMALGTVKWLQSFNAGLDQPFYHDLVKAGIRISGSSAQAIAIAEYIIANIMSHYQGVLAHRKAQTAHRWERSTFRELWRTKWLLVGFGSIGQALAERLRAFEVEVIGVRRSGKPSSLADIICTADRLPEQLPRADVVVLACPLTEETKRLANRGFFQQMKRGAILVNISRGKIVDTQALIASIESQQIEHAVLDVFDPEPLPPDSPLWDMKQVTITAHSSNAGNNTALRGDLLFLENLRRYLAEEQLLNEVRR